MPFKDPARAKAYFKLYDKRRSGRKPKLGTEGKLAVLIADLLDLRGRGPRDRLPNKIINAIKQAMTEALRRGEKVFIPGFGTFKIRTLPPIKHPFFINDVGEKSTPIGYYMAELPERKKVVFNPSKSLMRLRKEAAEN